VAVSKQITTCLAPWNVSQLADMFRDSFIGAGLMTAWFDSFTGSGYEHRIMKVTYDSTKTYGDTYYWWMFNGSEARVSLCTGWDSANRIPRGVGTTFGSPRLDWQNSSVAATAVTVATSHTLLPLSLTSSTNCSLTRYTSLGRSIFVARSGLNWFNFSIDAPSTTFQAYYGAALAGGIHNGMWKTTHDGSAVRFVNMLQTRRSLFAGVGYGSSSSIGKDVNMMAYGFTDVNFTNSYEGTYPDLAINLPCWYTASNPAQTSDFNPIFTNIRPGYHYAADLPSDFAITAFRGSSANSLSIQDTVVVTSGVEEYEVLGFQNRGTNGSSNPLFLARIVG